MLEEYFRNHKEKSHFLFFYYLIKNQIEEAIDLYTTLDPKYVKNLSLLETLLKIKIKRLPTIQKNNIFERFSFLNKKNNDEMILENTKDENELNKINFYQENEGKNNVFFSKKFIFLIYTKNISRKIILRRNFKKKIRRKKVKGCLYINVLLKYFFL